MYYWELFAFLLAIYQVIQSGYIQFIFFSKNVWLTIANLLIEFMVHVYVAYHFPALIIATEIISLIPIQYLL
jgi:hypothetical protein